MQELSKEKMALLDVIEEIKKQADALRAENTKKNTECNNYYREIAEIRDCLSNVTERTSIDIKNLGRSTSCLQVESLFSGKRTSRWTEDEISKALTLKSLSHYTYAFLREKWQFPLPSRSTLNRRVRKLNTEPGILSSVMQLLRCKAERERGSV